VTGNLLILTAKNVMLTVHFRAVQRPSVAIYPTANNMPGDLQRRASGFRNKEYFVTTLDGLHIAGFSHIGQSRDEHRRLHIGA
jgi:hypothetical protein